MSIRRVILTAITLVAFFISGCAYAQTGLYTYSGGYFIRNGNSWSEYRPADKKDVWATYTQDGEQDNFYTISNSSRSVAVPKSSSWGVFIADGNGGWSKIYDGRQVYNYFDTSNAGNRICCYEGGYFVQDGKEWTEYRPGDRQGIWARYELYNETETFWYIQHGSDIPERLAIAKDISNALWILRGDNWEKIYNPTDFYEPVNSSQESSSNGNIPGPEPAPFTSYEKDVKYDYEMVFNDCAVFPDDWDFYDESDTYDEDVERNVGTVIVRLNKDGYVQIVCEGDTYNTWCEWMVAKENFFSFCEEKIDKGSRVTFVRDDYILYEEVSGLVDLTGFPKLVLCDLDDDCDVDKIFREINECYATNYRDRE